MITREQVADLQPGDVVKLEGYPSLKGAAVAGPVWSDSETEKLCVGPFVIRQRNGDAPVQYDDDPDFTLTVVSRAPRLLYVNHPRTEPVVGDVIRDCDRDIWAHRSDGWQAAVPTDEYGDAGPEYFKPLTLLVDGETGQVVP